MSDWLLCMSIKWQSRILVDMHSSQSEISPFPGVTVKSPHMCVECKVDLLKLFILKVAHEPKKCGHPYTTPYMSSNSSLWPPVNWVTSSPISNSSLHPVCFWIWWWTSNILISSLWTIKINLLKTESALSSGKRMRNKHNKDLVITGKCDTPKF